MIKQNKTRNNNKGHCDCECVGGLPCLALPRLASLRFAVVSNFRRPTAKDNNYCRFSICFGHSSLFLSLLHLIIQDERPSHCKFISVIPSFDAKFQFWSLGFQFCSQSFCFLSLRFDTLFLFLLLGIVRTFQFFSFFFSESMLSEAQFLALNSRAKIVIIMFC